MLIALHCDSVVGITGLYGGVRTFLTRTLSICPFSINIGPIHINQSVLVSGSGWSISNHIHQGENKATIELTLNSGGSGRFPGFYSEYGEFVNSNNITKDIGTEKCCHNIRVRNNPWRGSHYTVLTHAEAKNHPTRSGIILCRVGYSAYTIHGLLPMIEI